MRENKATRHVLPSPPIPQLPKGSSWGGLNLRRGALGGPQASRTMWNPHIIPNTQEHMRDPLAAHTCGVHAGNWWSSPRVPWSHGSRAYPLVPSDPRHILSKGQRPRPWKALKLCSHAGKHDRGMMDTHRVPCRETRLRNNVNTQLQKTTGFWKTKLGWTSRKFCSVKTNPSPKSYIPYDSMHTVYFKSQKS